MATQFIEQPSGRVGAKFDAMLGGPDTSAGEDQDASFDRVASTYVCHDKKFLVPQRTYDRQYAQLYYARFQLMTPPLKEVAAEKWPGVAFAKVLDVGNDKPESEQPARLIVVGTIFKDQKLKPTVLDEYMKDRGMRAALDATTFCSDDDICILEDDGGRMKLRGATLPVQQLVTGVVIAVCGKAELGGDFFEVEEFCYLGLAPQVPLPVPPADAAGDKYVALVSGLGLARTGADPLKIQLAVDFLSGQLGGPNEQALASHVTRVIIAGGTVGGLEALATAAANSRQQSAAMQPIKDMDLVVTELSAALPVDLMPGAEDPTNVALPQQPLHRCLFPGAAGYGSHNRVTNPHEFDVDGVGFLGTSGQNVDDISKYSRHEDRLAMLELCLRWRHLAPTCPDTLTCYPYHDIDPFILSSTPHVFFVGNQPEFAVGEISGPSGTRVRLVAIPAFHRTPMLVLVNLRTLDCHPISFEGADGCDVAKMDTGA
ncbi:hypothetical protein FOA52_002579 [Chlamydomonas sp. UWO 241]|nr:hypothetical protein FOA52_002579 [Chlamydomonas sp. UWO 241]